MNSPLRSRIGVIFAGGAAIEGRRAPFVIRRRSDLDSWIGQMSEMAMIADVDGFYIVPDQGTVGLPEWRNIAQLIGQEYKRFDGFLILHQSATITFGAVMLRAMLENLGKPVVLASSPLGGETRPGNRLGAKAGFINALQVAVSSRPGIFMVEGNRILASGSDPDAVIGKIDFGIRFFQVPPKRAGIFRVRNKIETRIASLEFVPGLDIRQWQPLGKGMVGVCVAFPDRSGALGVSLAALAGLWGPGKPVVVFGWHEKDKLPPNVLVMNHGSRTATVLQFMWALGQSHRPGEWKHILARLWAARS